MLSKCDNNFLLKYAEDSKDTQMSLIESVDRLIGKANTDEHCELSKSFLGFLIGIKTRYPTAYSEAKIENTGAYIKAVNTRKILSCVESRLKELDKKFISGSSLENLVQRTVGNDPELLEKVANLVEKNFSDKNEQIYFVKVCNLEVKEHQFGMMAKKYQLKIMILNLRYQ